MIGIIFNPGKLSRIVKGQEIHENMEYYYNLAKENEVDLLLYAVQRLRYASRKVKGFLYSHKDQQLKEKVVEIPTVNLFRTIVYRKQDLVQLRKIERDYHVHFINLSTERNKYKIYHYLKCIKKVSDFIPDTDRLSYKSLIKFLNKYHKIVIKPINGALGERIFVIEKVNQKYIIHYTFQRKQHKKVLQGYKLFEFYKKAFPIPSFYLIQQWISFRKYQGEKFDVRTSVQKDKEGEWKVTGIVTRVAGKNRIVTNIAQGGRAVPFKDIHPFLRAEIDYKIKEFSLDIATELEKLYPSTADLGLDIAIDDGFKLWFIEANYCDERYSYRESNDLDMWQASYRVPFEYAYAEYNKS